MHQKAAHSGIACVLQCFDASQPTASQLVPKPHSPEASLPSQSPEASAVFEPPAVSTPSRQQQHWQEQAASHEQDRLGSAHELNTRQEESGAAEADPDVLDSAAGQSELQAAPAGATVRYSNAVSAPLANAAGSAAEAADASQLAAVSTVPSGQPVSPASSSDLQLEIFLGAAPAMHSAPAHAAGSSQNHPDRVAPGVAASSHVAPVRETAAAPADGPGRAGPTESAPAAATGQALPVWEVMEVEIDSNYEPQEPLWEPEPAPKPPAGCATITILETMLDHCSADSLCTLS